MGDRLKKIHFFVCALLCTSWFVGIIFMGISKFVFHNENQIYFFNLVHPYNAFVLLCSLIPVEPILFIAALIKSSKGQHKIKDIISTVIVFMLTSIIWCIYIYLYVSWTGGV